MRGTLDSVDEGSAVIALDSGGTARVPADALPPGAREGDRVAIELTLDREETQRRRAELAERRRRASKGDDGGDIEL